MKKNKTTFKKILEDTLVGKTLKNIYIEKQHKDYGYLTPPRNSLGFEVSSGIIKEVEICLPDYETGYIAIIIDVDGKDVKIYNDGFEEFMIE
jgi:ribulose bisphosphate carboxylase small subunit